MVKDKNIIDLNKIFSLRKILIFFIITYPVISIISRGLNDILFYAIFFIGVCFVFKSKSQNEISFKNFLRDNFLLFLPTTSLIVVVALNQIFVSGYKFTQFRDPISFFIFPFILYGMIFLSSKELAYIKYGLIAGAIFIFLVLFIKTDYGSERVIYVTRTFALIPYTGVALVIGIMSFLSIFLSDSRNKVLVVFSLIALVFGFCSAFIGQARGVWIAIPVFLFILFFFASKNLILNSELKKKLNIVFSVSLLVIIMMFVFSPIAQERISYAKKDIQEYLDGSEKDTSLGIRFQLYKSAILMAKDNPVVGIKYKTYMDKQKKLAEEGIITEVASTFWHAHNEMLQYLLSYGVLGFLSLISIYAMPFLYCFKNRLSNDIKTNAAAYAGCILGVGFFIYGLSEVLLIRRGLINFYVFSFSFLIAFIMKRKQEIETEKKGLLDFNLIST